MDKLLTIIFTIFFLILFPLGSFARIDLPYNIAITGIDVGIIILICTWIAKLIIQRKKINFSLIKPLLMFLIICLISLLFNLPHLKQYEFFVALLYLIRFACYASLYFIISSLNQDRKKIISLLMVLSGLFLLIIGYIQYFFYPSLRNLYYLGWDEHLYRMFGSFLDPNFFGAFLVLYFLFILNNVIARRNDEAISWIVLFSKGLPRFARNDVIFYYFLLLATLVAIILTYSRSAYLMFFCGLITFFIIKKPSKKIILATCILIIVSLISYFSFTKYSEGTNLLRTTSTKARIITSQNALIIFQNNPVLGVGFNAYRYSQERYGFIEQNSNFVNHGGAGADNSFLFILATTGIIGFLAYMYLWWKIVIMNKKNVLIIASIAAIVINAFFINSLFYPCIMIWMWMIIGLRNTIEI